MSLAHLAVSTPMDHVMDGTEAVPYHCVICGVVLREWLLDGRRITWHRAPVDLRCLLADNDQDSPQ